MTMVATPNPTRQLTVDRLYVVIFSTRAELGQAAAIDVVERIEVLLRTQDTVRMVFAAAPSQNEFLACLSTYTHIDWRRVEAFHMDEYIGLGNSAPQSFACFLKKHLFGRLPFGRIEYINGAAPDAQAECRRYAALLAEKSIDITCAGIGENGHMAFNDPPVADFDDPLAIKLVEMDQVCRQQQVHDGAFPNLDAVPRWAITLTMPTLMSAQCIYCMVPGPTKAQAVKHSLHDMISTACPATIMRQHTAAKLYLDTAAAILL
ncbi:MAG: glucosamine-6-phosphate deaminase [Anaerolineae bacterium]